LNPHSLNGHKLLRLTRLPIPPLPHVRKPLKACVLYYFGRCESISRTPRAYWGMGTTPARWGTSPVGSPHRFRAGAPLRYAGLGPSPSPNITRRYHTLTNERQALIFVCAWPSRDRRRQRFPARKKGILRNTSRSGRPLSHENRTDPRRIFSNRTGFRYYLKEVQ
jgi:hypothetical protein